MVLCFLTRPRVASASVFLSFELPTCDGILSVFVSSPFLCLVSIWNYLSVVLARWVASGFLGAPSGSVYGSFLRRFLFLLVSVAFALLALP